MYTVTHKQLLSWVIQIKAAPQVTNVRTHMIQIEPQSWQLANTLRCNAGLPTSTIVSTADVSCSAGIMLHTMLHTPSLQFRPCWIPPMLDIRLSRRIGARERGFQYNAPPFRLYACSQLLRAPSIVFPTTHRLSRAFTPLNARQRSLCTPPMLAFVLNILYNTSTSCCSTYTALLSRLCFHNNRGALRRK